MIEFEESQGMLMNIDILLGNFMPQKILLLTKNYPPQIGGIEKYSFDLYNQLVKEGNIVKLIVA